MRATLRWMCLAATVLLGSCGGGHVAVDSAETSHALQSAGSPRQLQALGTAEAADALMDFGERQFPGYFPAAQPSQSLPPFRYRHYPQTGIYLGVVVSADPNYVLDGVYVMGGEFGPAPVRVGVVRDFIDTSGAPPECAGNACYLLAQRKNCLACHTLDKKLVGPPFNDIGRRYAGTAGAAANLAVKIRNGGVGVWGPIPMPAAPGVTVQEADLLARWILSLPAPTSAR